jgi:hypothetical protein
MSTTPVEQFETAVRAGQVARVRELLEQHAEVRDAISQPRFDFDSPAIHQAKKSLPMVDVLRDGFERRGS